MHPLGSSAVGGRHFSKLLHRRVCRREDRQRLRYSQQQRSPVREHTAGMEWAYAVGKRSPAGEEIQRRENVAMFKRHMMRGRQ